MDLVLVVLFALARKVDKLKDKWPTSDDTAASRQEVSPDDVFEYRGFS